MDEVDGPLIAGAGLGGGVLNKIMQAIGDIDRKIAIGVENKSGHKWEALNVYYRSGTSDIVMPHNVPTGKALLYNGRKDMGSVATGLVAVIAYYIKGLDKTLAVMFSVPFDYSWYSNWWDVKIYDGNKRAEEYMYKDMYYGSPFKGDDGWYKKAIGTGLKFSGAMASSGKATLEIHVEKA